MKILTPYNYEISEGSKNTMPSMTIPDQTMPIRTILERYAKGLPTVGQRNPIYEDADIDNHLPDPRTMDLAERQQFKEYAKQEQQNIMKNHNIKRDSLKAAETKTDKGQGEA